MADGRTFAPHSYSGEEEDPFHEIQTYLKFGGEMEDNYWRRFKNSIEESPENDG